MAACCMHKTMAALGLLLLVLSSFHGSLAQSDELSDDDFHVLLQDLRSRGFFTGATILTYVARSYLTPSRTLLIPTDKSMAAAASLDPKIFPALIEFHILDRNLDFKQLKLLPVGTWLPTALPGYGVQITNNSATNLSIDNAHVVDADICPRLANAGFACQGISAILNPASQLSPRPSNPPLEAVPPSPPPPSAVVSSPAPSTVSPLQVPSPSPSPSPFPFVTPLQVSSPSPSPSPEVSPLQVPSPSPMPSASVFPLQGSSPLSSPSPSPSLVPSTPLIEPLAPTSSSPSSAPSPFPSGAVQPKQVSPSPSPPIFEGPASSPFSPFQLPPIFGSEAPAPGPSASGAAGATIERSQINIFGLTAIGGLILMMV